MSLSVRLRMSFRQSRRENQNMHFVFNNFFPENGAVYEIIWKKCCRAGQATDDRRAHAHCMVNAWGYKDTHKICNTYCFSTATMVTWTLLNCTLLVHCLSCFSHLHKPRNTVLVLLVESWLYPSPRLAVCQATKRYSIKATQWIQMIKSKTSELVIFNTQGYQHTHTIKF